MTDPSSQHFGGLAGPAEPTGPVEPAKSVEAVESAAAGANPRPPQNAAGRRMWPALTTTLALLGAGSLAAAALVPGPVSAPVAPSPTATTQAPVPPQTPAAMPSASPVEARDMSIAELADPAWVSRIAAAGDIPERALYAYAGAAIEVSKTNPTCGLGWNTLAAIGLTETGHGTMNGAAVGPDGTVTPVIIGAPLDGNGTDRVPDTDGGTLDGDVTWDHAVGPMQFIPSTWAKTARDGNRDGQSDINQFDDAALAAATHLCEVGGDLTKSQNWIAAISAYNPSVEYNNRVAEAANRYAALR